MSDQLKIQNGKLLLTTQEGQRVEQPESALVEMLRQEIEAPLGNLAMPDGVKFVQWRPPFLVVVHQMSAHVRQLRWLANDSPSQFGPGTKYRSVRISIPYAITFALYYYRKNLALTGYNELYFRNEPLRNRSDKLGYPALLNISAIETSNRIRSWVCTEHLQCSPRANWTEHLSGLLEHTWNGAFNMSSEHHEGASWYTASKGVHKNLHPIEKWEQATLKDEAFALRVPWKPAPMNVGQLMDSMLTECQHSVRVAGIPHRFTATQQQPGIVQRFINFAQRLNKKSA